MNRDKGIGDEDWWCMGIVRGGRAPVGTQGGSWEGGRSRRLLVARQAWHDELAEQWSGA